MIDYGISVLDLKNYSYNEVESKLIEIRTRELDNEGTKSKTKIFEEIIEYSLYLYGATNRIVDTNYRLTGERVNDKDTWISEMYERNCIYLISAYELCRSGFMNPAYVILRSVFEVVNKIYYMHLATEDAFEFLLKVETDESSDNPLTASEMQKLKRKPDKKKPEKVGYDYFSPKFIRDELYELDSDKKRNIEELYRIISKRTHPTVTSAHSSFIIDEEMLDDTLIGIITLGIANVIVYWETWFNLLNDNGIAKCDSLFKKMHQNLDVILIDIVPNKGNILPDIIFKDLESIERYFET